MTQEEERLRAEVARLEEESRQWEKASLVKLLQERDQLREELAQVKAERDTNFSLYQSAWKRLQSLEQAKHMLADTQSALNEHMDTYNQTVNELIDARGRIAELEKAQEAHAWTISPAMAQAKIDELNAKIAELAQVTQERDELKGKLFREVSDHTELVLRSEKQQQRIAELEGRP
jgi:uncharacterized coiled-coil DUF342 family protein